MCNQNRGAHHLQKLMERNRCFASGFKEENNMRNQILDCINNRVSLRTYDIGTEITDEELQAILEAAMPHSPDSRK